MAKTILVFGATGQMGGSVAWRLLKEGWKVKAVTRNTGSEKAQALIKAGAEAVTADYGNEESLAKAFEGVNAAFVMTTPFDRFFEVGREQACKDEYEQMLAISKVASKTEGLEHYILHTLPSGEKMAGKEYFTPHMDYKDMAADELKKTMPELAKKTTFLWVGIFPSNFYQFPMMKPAELPNSHGAHAWIQPISGDTKMYVSGDIDHNIGVFASAILAKPNISLPAKYAFVYTDVMPYKGMMEQWSEVTGRRSTYVQVDRKTYEGLWGTEYGTELALMFEAMEKQPDWSNGHGDDVVDGKALGIPESDLLNLKASLEKDKVKL